MYHHLICNCNPPPIFPGALMTALIMPNIFSQVEELQWRIKHKNELPPTQVFSPTTSLSTSCTDEEFTPSPAGSGLNGTGSTRPILKRPPVSASTPSSSSLDNNSNSNSNSSPRACSDNNNLKDCWNGRSPQKSE